MWRRRTSSELLSRCGVSACEGAQTSPGRERRRPAGGRFDGSLPAARIIGAELHVVAGQNGRMGRITAQHRHAAIALLEDSETEFGINPSQFADQSVSHK